MKILKSAVGSLPSLGVIKELQFYNVEVVGMDSDPYAFGKVFLEYSYTILPYEDPEFVSKIFQIIKIEKPDAIMLGVEGEILKLSKYKKDLKKKNVIFLHPDHYYASICIDKLLTYDYFLRNNIPFPALYGKSSVKFPCFVKPRMGSGSKDTYKIEEKDKELLKYLLNKRNDLIIQEYVDGKEYSIDVLADQDGNCICIVPRERLKTSNGICVTGRTVENEILIKYTKKIVKGLKLFGFSCIQCIKNEKGVKFIEINNRLGGGGILSIKANPEIIPSLLKIIKGEKVFPALEYIKDLYMSRNYIEAFSD